MITTQLTDMVVLMSVLADVIHGWFGKKHQYFWPPVSMTGGVINEQLKSDTAVAAYYQSANNVVAF